MESSLSSLQQVGSNGTCGRSAYRILVVLTEPCQEEYLREYADALARHQSAVVRLLRDYDVEEAPLSGDCSETIVDGGVGALSARCLLSKVSLSERIVEVFGSWPFDMMIADWPRKDGDVALFARLVRDIDTTAILVRHRGFPCRRLIVPAGGGVHALEGVRIADALAKQWSLDTQVLRVVLQADSYWMQRADLKLRRRQIRNATRLYLDVADVNMPIRVCLGSDVASVIVRRSQGGDLVVIGGSSQWLMENQFSASIPSRVAKEVSGTTMMVLTNRGRPSALTEVFWEQTIRVGLRAEDKTAAIQLLVDALVEQRQVPFSRREEIVAAVMEREQFGSTHIGHGTAIPHAALHGFRGLVGILGVFTDPVPFAKDDATARFVFLLLTPKESYDVYLPILARIARYMNESKNRQQLIHAKYPEEVVDLLKQAEIEWRTEGH